MTPIARQTFSTDGASYHSVVADDLTKRVSFLHDFHSVVVDMQTGEVSSLPIRTNFLAFDESRGYYFYTDLDSQSPNYLKLMGKQVSSDASPISFTDDVWLHAYDAENGIHYFSDGNTEILSVGYSGGPVFQEATLQDLSSPITALYYDDGILMWANESVIVRRDISSRAEVTYEAPAGSSGEFKIFKNKVYWLENQVLFRQNFDGTGREIVMEDVSLRIQDLAILSL